MESVSLSSSAWMSLEEHTIFFRFGDLFDGSDTPFFGGVSTSVPFPLETAFAFMAAIARDHFC
jgi:hypothetical protein